MDEKPAFELTAHAERRVRERKIDPRWIAAALDAPDRVKPDPLDPAARHALKRIDEMDGRVLRVVFNFQADPVRVISVHFDRRLRGTL